MSEWTISPPWLEAAQLGVAALLLVAAFVCLPVALAGAWAEFRDDRPAARGLLGALVLGGLIRFVLAPHRLAMVFIGYRVTRDALELLPIAQYGAGAGAFYHAWFAVLPHDHASIMWVNAVCGWLALPLVATFAARVAGDRRVGAVAAVLAAATPMFVRNDTSEANLVPCLLWLFGGLTLFQSTLATGRRTPLLAAVPLLALAIVSRPELLVIAPALVVCLALVRPAVRPPWRDGACWAAAAVTALLVLPHALHVVRAFQSMRGLGNLPGVATSPVVQLVLSVVDRNALLSPTLFPVAFLGLALCALVLGVRGGARRPALVLLAMALAAFLPYFLDADEGNIARVHAPAGLFVALLASVGLVALWDRVTNRIVRGALVVVVVSSLLPSAVRLWAPTNEQAEEELIRDAHAALPQRFVLVRMQWPDKDRGRGGHTQVHFPDYLFRSGGKHGQLLAVSEWLEQPETSEAAYFFFGFRCYAAFRAESIPAPSGEDLHPLCARMRDEFTLTPVIEQTAQNHGDVWLRYYGDAPTLKVGLYKIGPLR